MQYYSMNILDYLLLVLLMNKVWVTNEKLLHFEKKKAMYNATEGKVMSTYFRYKAELSQLTYNFSHVT